MVEKEEKQKETKKETNQKEKTDKKQISKGEVTEEKPTKEKAEQVKAEDKVSTKKKKRRTVKKKISKYEELKIKYNELNDKYLRLYSEFDNFRKRKIKEGIELTKTASVDVIVSILPILDDLERAEKSFDDTDDVKALKEGVCHIKNKFKNIIKQKGIEEIESIGKEFNTDFHEAITNIPAPSKDMKGKIIDEIEKGYIQNGKVIRYAKVVVGN